MSSAIAPRKPPGPWLMEQDLLAGDLARRLELALEDDVELGRALALVKEELPGRDAASRPAMTIRSRSSSARPSSTATSRRRSTLIAGGVAIGRP